MHESGAAPMKRQRDRSNIALSAINTAVSAAVGVAFGAWLTLQISTLIYTCALAVAWAAAYAFHGVAKREHDAMTAKIKETIATAQTLSVQTQRMQ